MGKTATVELVVGTPSLLALSGPASTTVTVQPVGLDNFALYRLTASASNVGIASVNITIAVDTYTVRSREIREVLPVEFLCLCIWWLGTCSERYLSAACICVAHCTRMRTFPGI